MIVYGEEDNDNEKDGGRGTNPSTPTRTRRKENVVANFMMDQYISSQHDVLSRTCGFASSRQVEYIKDMRFTDI